MTKTLVGAGLLYLLTFATSCTYSRGGYLVYLPSEANPKFRFFVGASQLGKFEEGRSIDQLLQISLYEQKTNETLLLFRKKDTRD
jgi:hypothetical protein